MKQFIFIIIALALAGAGAKWLVFHKPEIKKQSKKVSLPVVKVTPLNKQDYRIVIHSSGTVEAQTQTNLVAEVAGKIIKIGKAFQEGHYINKNSFLLKIDETDYLNDITIANADIAQQQLGLQEQLVQRKLAQQDWDLFGEKNKKQPSQLALRTPHIASAKAGLQAAKIRKQQAETHLSRTSIRSPYNGRVLERTVDVGQFVTRGTTLGKVFATDSIEVRLPLSLADYELLAIPEHYQGEKKPNMKNLPPVNFYMNASQKSKGNQPTRHMWQGKVVRTSASLDSSTRQIAVIARISKPFARSNKDTHTPTIKLGQFLQADILGKHLSNVAIIPTSAVRDGKEILLLVDDAIDDAIDDVMDHVIKVQTINILHTDNDNVIIATEGIPDNSQLILTLPPFATDGMKVKVFNDQKTVDDKTPSHKPALKPTSTPQTQRPEL